MRLFATPRAAAKRAAARSAIPRGVRCARSQDSSTRRSASESRSAVAGLFMTHDYTIANKLSTYM